MKKKISYCELSRYENCFRFCRLPVLMRRQLSIDFDIPKDYGPRYGEMYRTAVEKAVSEVIGNKNLRKKYSRWVEFPHSPRGGGSCGLHAGVVKEAASLRWISMIEGPRGVYRGFSISEIEKRRGSLCDAKIALFVARELDGVCGSTHVGREKGKR